VSPQDWRDLAKVFTTGEVATYGIHDPTTMHLGTVFRAMASKCTEIARQRDSEVGTQPLTRRPPAGSEPL